MNRWQRKAYAQVKISESNRGNEAGIAARRKIAEIISRHPEARFFDPVKRLIEDDKAANDVSMIRILDPDYNIVKG